MLLTTAPTSSMNSSEAPVMTGGTVEDTGLQSRRVSASEDLDQVQRNVCVLTQDLQVKVQLVLARLVDRLTRVPSPVLCLDSGDLQGLSTFSREPADT